MSTKQQIIDNINSRLASAQPGGITAEQHRSALGNDNDSVVSNLFGESTVETQASAGILTPNANWNYTVQINKIGNMVNLTGQATALASNLSQVFAIANSEYVPSSNDNVGIGFDSLTDSVVKINVLSGEVGDPRLQILDITSGQIIQFNISYFVSP